MHLNVFPCCDVCRASCWAPWKMHKLAPFTMAPWSSWCATSIWSEKQAASASYQRPNGWEEMSLFSRCSAMAHYHQISHIWLTPDMDKQAWVHRCIYMKSGINRCTFILLRSPLHCCFEILKIYFNVQHFFPPFPSFTTFILYFTKMILVTVKNVRKAVQTHTRTNRPKLIFHH